MAHIMTQHADVSRPAGPTRPAREIRAWGRLCFGLLIIWTFIFVLAPLFQKIPFMGKIADAIRKSGIEAGALYYTEVEAVGDSTRSVQNTFRFYLDPKKGD